MSKTKAVAVTQAAQMAGGKLALWDAVEAEAKNRLAEAEAKKELGDLFRRDVLELAEEEDRGDMRQFLN